MVSIMQVLPISYFLVAEGAGLVGFFFSWCQVPRFFMGGRVQSGASGVKRLKCRPAKIPKK